MSHLAAPRKRSEALVEGEYALTVRNFDQIAGLLRAQSGIALTEAKAALVYSRLAKRLRKLDLADFDAYCEFLEKPEGVDERYEMLAALTTNVTRFFREPHHFDHLRAFMAPLLERAVENGTRVRLWSAACSSGEESYSIALTVLDLLPEAKNYDIRILATDIDPKVVAKAKTGVYREDAVAPIAPVLRERWMTRELVAGERVWRVKDDLRSIITFNELNLIGEWPMRGRFDAIFCRNVVIYFEEDTQVALWKRFKSVLSADGRLYIGHSERIDVPGYASDGLTVYRLAGGGAP